MIFLFPNDCFNPKKPDAAYRDRFLAFQQAGFKTALIEIESLNNSTTKIYPNLFPGDSVVYLGWMLSKEDYIYLSQIIQKAEAKLWNNITEYLHGHYLCNWYPYIADLTPETKIFTLDANLVTELNKLNWERYFIKDYVKSLKTSVGSIIDIPEEINTVVAEMQKYRGVIEGGICVRRVEDFIPESERRYFVINQKAFSANSDEIIPDIVYQCAKKITLNFFSVDVIERKDGVKRIVEIGDGQVSDLVNWSIERFIQIWKLVDNSSPDLS